jgi:hypothetical protein
MRPKSRVNSVVFPEITASGPDNLRAIVDAERHPEGAA